MKKIIIFVVVCFFINCKYVNASIVSWNYIPGVYSNRYLNGKNYSGPIGYAHLEGKLVYCINPYIGSGTDYMRNDSILAKYSSSDLDYLSLVAHYGEVYYPQNPYYFLAAQELIWRRVTGGNKVTFSTEYKEGGTKIDISSYKQVMEDVIKREMEGPKFETYEVRGDVFSTISLIDSNFVLKDYELKNLSSHKVQIDEGILRVKILDDKEGEIRLTRKIDGERMGFSTPNGQDLAYFSGFQKTIQLKIIPTNQYSEKIRIFHTYHNKPISSYFEFQIFDTKMQKLVEHNGETIFKTTEEGEFLSEFTLPRGSYEVIDVNAVNPFLSGSRISFQIEQLHEDGVSEVFLEVASPTGKVNYNRYQSLYNKNRYPVPNVCYFLYSKEEIYGPDGEWLYPKGGYLGFTCTDHNGYLEFDQIPLGEYELVEDFDPTHQNYIYDNQKIPISIQYQDEQTNSILISSEKTIDYPKQKIHLWSYQEHFLGVLNQTAMYEMVPSNVEYGLYADQVLLFNEELWGSGDLIACLSSLKNGFREFGIPLPKGTYYVMPILGGKKIYFQVKEEDKIDLEFYHKLEKGTVKIEVLDELGKHLQQQLFTLFYNNSTIFRGTTDQLGTILLEDLPCGYYQLLDDQTHKVHDFYLPGDGKTILIKRVLKEDLENPDEDDPPTGDSNNNPPIENPSESEEHANEKKEQVKDDSHQNSFSETKFLPRTKKTRSNQFHLGLFGILILIYVIIKYF